MTTFKEKLADPGRRLSTHICVIPSPVVTQAIAAAGADAVIIDLEHGAVDYGSAHAMIAATAGTECAALVRVAKIDAALVKRVMDLGAAGIVFPLVRTAGEAREAVACLRYPPEGKRGWGPFIAHSREQVGLLDYVSEIGPEAVCCLLIETVEAVENIEEIFAVEGVDFAFVAQFDLSTALGASGDFEAPAFKAAVERVEQAAFAAGIPLGAAAFHEAQAKEAFAKGYRVIGGFDVLWLKAAVSRMTEWTEGAVE